MLAELRRRSSLEPVEGLAAARRQSSALRGTAHRPWPAPTSSWLMGQSWEHVLFAHWPVPVQALRPHVPAALEVEEFEGSAWIGVTPFEVRGLHLRWLAPLPVASRFPELNTRTYVRVGQRPGIFFFSLDAGSVTAVRAARLAYRLPYFRAAMSIACEAGGVRYRSSRLAREKPQARLDAIYQPSGPAFAAAPGTLEHFLTERYRLYRVDPVGGVHHADIHHRPWRLRPARAEIRANSMIDFVDGPAGDRPAHLLYSRRQDTVVWPPARTVDAGQRRPRPTSGSRP